MWSIEVRHQPLNKYRKIKGRDRAVVEQKADAQLATWDEMWAKKEAAAKRKAEREAAMESKEEKKTLALDKTKDAEGAIAKVEGILAHTLLVDDAIDWNTLISNGSYAVAAPIKPELRKVPEPPKREEYKADIWFLDKIIPGAKKKKISMADNRFEGDYAAWEKLSQEAEKENNGKKTKFKKAYTKWEKDRQAFKDKQEANNNAVKAQQKKYSEGESAAISDYCEMVLANSEYPESFPQEWDLEYNAEQKMLIVDYSLPNLEAMPTTKAVKYIATRDDFTSTQISKAALNKLYDNALYQIALRTVHELYEADTVGGLEVVVFNGWVDAVDKATGQDVNSCIMSLQAGKDEFWEIDLGRVDPKACFKKLKGVGSSKLISLSPVAPIISIDKTDRRFVPAYDVADGIGEEDNLAAMDWQDFENLIREIFEKEFATTGGEVKVTQASKDGGVDAIAFDPDPIRGGKIVIQAKRYTNTVGVSAVRDLYGTTMNEGATKGILVTTADYGPDAYEFAKGKPLSLLSGANLLHLLEKQGHRAKIDIREAKKILAEQVRE
ncbi:hypothetical protein PSDVSF_23460 [Pseudodesulfovibrio sediminis]|uniref:Restriction endonuclease type IV Mrr domain-containing protein n=2 Tax=Pseudodesulfovibrio sediminis TaxID=2810563 RepID=A0ABM7P821_9BACT|nr:hypothetical protein PSDVSF_23460 [Pseudodesulfovibrio sediminis]